MSSVLLPIWLALAAAPGRAAERRPPDTAAFPRERIWMHAGGSRPRVTERSATPKSWMTIL